MTGDQKIQEQQYNVPYHWFLCDDEYRGRKYFGYLRLAVKKLKKFGLTEEGLVLDAGCGDGRFIKELKDQKYKVEGADYSARAIAMAKALLPDVMIKVADFTDSDTLVGLGPYEGIFLIETLEHIFPDDIPIFLENLASLLDKDGLIAITVPSQLLPLHDKHYQHFTSESLKNTVEDYFNIVEISGYTNAKRPILSLCYKFLDNRYWDAKKLSRWFNKKVWPKYFNECGPYSGEGLILVGRKK